MYIGKLWADHRDPQWQVRSLAFKETFPWKSSENNNDINNNKESEMGIKRETHSDFIFFLVIVTGMGGCMKRAQGRTNIKASSLLFLVSIWCLL